MKKLFFVLLLLGQNLTYADSAEGLYWYTENKIIVEGDRKEGLRVNKNNTITMINDSLKPYLTCQINANNEEILIFTCKLGKRIKIFKYNVADNGKYLFRDNDPDHGGYIK